MVIVSGGCSFARGRELPPPRITYAKHLAAMCGAELCDVSRAGAANETIASSIIAGINYCTNTFPDSKIVAIVGWTEQLRQETITRTGNIISTNFKRQGMEVDPQCEPAFSDPAYGYYKFHVAFSALNTFCDHNSIPLINLQSIPTYKTKLRQPDPALNPTSYIDDEFYPYTDMGNHMFTDFMLTGELKERERVMRTEPTFAQITKVMKDVGATSHPGKRAHRWWASYIKDKYGDVLGA